MPAKNPFKSHDLKKQLHATHAKRRSNGLQQTRIAAVLDGHGRNDLQPKLLTAFKPIDALRASENRMRETTPEILESTIRSIKRYGLVLPILIDKHNTIVAGHVLWEAAVALGMETVECRVVDHLDPLELEALSLALNRIGEIGKYNLDVLRDRMIAIESHGIELISTGFTLPEISQIKLPAILNNDDADDAPSADLNAPLVARVGDLFGLGEHLLLCGDAVDEVSYQRLLGQSKAHAVFSDAPYNCKIEGFVGGLGQHKHADFIKFAGKETDAEFFQFLQSYLNRCREFTTAGAVIFACMDWRQIDLLLAAGRAADLDRINVAVWNKGAGGMGGLYRSAHEFIAVFCNGSSPATNNVALGAHGRDRTNVWTFAGANRRGSSAAEALADHPTPKPVELVVESILDVTHPGDIVLDPFSGSGTTIVACEHSDRRARCIELDPKYVDRTIRRWERLTGKTACHIESGLTFADLAERRLRENAENGNV